MTNTKLSLKAKNEFLLSRTVNERTKVATLRSLAMSKHLLIWQLSVGYMCFACYKMIHDTTDMMIIVNKQSHNIVSFIVTYSI